MYFCSLVFSFTKRILFMLFPFLTRLLFCSLAVLAEEAFARSSFAYDLRTRSFSQTRSLILSLSLSPSQHACCQNYSLPSVLHVCSYHVSNPTCNLLIVRFFFFLLLYYVLVPLLPTHPTWFIAKILLSLNASRYFRKMTVVPRNYRVQW